MNAKETYDFLEAILTSPSSRHRDAANYELVIKTSEPHLSGQGIVPIKSLSIGGDWYQGKILVTPDKGLVPKESHRDVAQKPIPWGVFYPYAPAGIANTPCCPNCETNLKHSWAYCPECGQKLNWEK